MLLKLDNPKAFSDVISIISEIVNEVRVRFDKSGLNIVAIDPANVALVIFKIPASSFSQFETGEETIGINLEDFKQVLRRVSSGSSLIMEREDNQIKLQVQDKIKRNFTLALIDIESEDKAAPNLDFSNKIEMSSIDLTEAIEDCAVVADACALSVKDGKFIIEAKGSLNSAKSEYSGDEAKVSGGEAKSKYSLEYLQKFVRAARLTDKALIQFSTDYPLRLDFNTQGIELGFILAPRVENED